MCALVLPCFFEGFLWPFVCQSCQVRVCEFFAPTESGRSLGVPGAFFLSESSVSKSWSLCVAIPLSKIARGAARGFPARRGACARASACCVSLLRAPACVRQRMRPPIGAFLRRRLRSPLPCPAGCRRWVRSVRSLPSGSRRRGLGAVWWRYVCRCCARRAPSIATAARGCLL